MKYFKHAVFSIFGSVLLAALVSGCTNPDYRAENIDLKANEQVKDQVFSQILDNQELFDEFMNEMMQHEQSMQWMMNSNRMMQHMYSTDNMQNLMQQNPDMRDHMMQGWMDLMNQDTSFYNRMNHMMDQGHMGQMR